jgi:membrane-associated phospholipid phosphatase
MAEQSSAPEDPKKGAPPPEQQPGDTPVPPWKMPTAEEKEAAKPVRRALRKALSEVDSPEKADAVLDELAAATAGTRESDVAKAEPKPASTEEAAQRVEAAAEQATDGNAAPAVLAETARVLASATGREREAVAEAAQEIFNAEQQGAPAAGEQVEREYLRQAVLRRLKPLDKIDAMLFLKINHLPHTRLLNLFFYVLTLIFTGGAAWFALMGGTVLRKPGLGVRMLREATMPLAVATWLVEYPVKYFFRRRRPFITIIQAITIGMKPGTWSFPSGHSAAAFAGAWLLSRYLPKWRGRLFAVASLVAFSRVYLGDHYPGDVVAGSALGALLAEILRRIPWPFRPQKHRPKP